MSSIKGQTSIRAARLDAARASLLALLDDLDGGLAALEASHQRLAELRAEMERAIAAFQERLQGYIAGEHGPAAPDLTPVEAQRQLMEMTQSFNLQYLNLQQQMQDESRRFTLLSNIMKTKHDTARNSISNLR